MKNFKLTIVFSAVGFILSFVFGLFSGSGFFRILLTALIFGVGFAALSFLIQFLSDRFLSVDSYGDSSDSGNSNKNGVTSSVNPDAPAGQKVNIIIQDEELEQSGNSNHFDVGNNHQMLNESDVSKVSPQILDSISEKPDFVPVRRKETVDNISGVEAITPDMGNGNKKNAARAEQIINDSGDDSLGVLPDMSELSVSSVGAESGNAGDDSFTDLSPSSYSSSKNEGSGNIENASIMAKAISSILSGDDE